MIILHGENQVATREQLTTLRQAGVKQGKQLVELGSDITMGQLISAVESNSLFGSSHLVVVENVFSGRPSNERKLVMEYLLAHSAADILVWEGKDVSAKLKDFGSQLVRRFDLPKYVFKFLDDLSLGNLQLSLQTAAAEQILALLAGHVHKLILVKEGATSLPSWQSAKLKQQMAKFSLDKLMEMSHQLLEIDYAQKTSAAPYDLATALEIFVVKLN